MQAAPFLSSTSSHMHVACSTWYNQLCFFIGQNVLYLFMSLDNRGLTDAVDKLIKSVDDLHPLWQVD